MGSVIQILSNTALPPLLILLTPAKTLHLRFSFASKYMPYFRQIVA